MQTGRYRGAGCPWRQEREVRATGLAFGYDAAQGAIVDQLRELVEQQSAEILQSMIYSAGNRSSGTLATIIGIGTLLLTATGAFGEIQTSLNAIWKAEPSSNLSQLVRARLLSLGLVVTLGFLMLVSLVVSAALAALEEYLNSLFPAGHLMMSAMSFVISLTLIAVLFAAIYKILPDKPIAWRDVAAGAVVTAVLFTIGKSIIGLYIGSSNVASSYGAAGAFLIILYGYITPRRFLPIG